MDLIKLDWEIVADLFGWLLGYYLNVFIALQK